MPLVETCSYRRTLHAARVQDGLPMPDAATISITALRYGPHGRLRAPRTVVDLASCECGEALRMFDGHQLCPECDQEHVAELQAMGARCSVCGYVLAWDEPSSPKHQGLAVPYCVHCDTGQSSCCAACRSTAPLTRGS